MSQKHLICKENNSKIFKGARTSCCINWYSRSSLYMSYNFFLFICVYLLPLLILTISNTIIYVGLKRMKNRIKQGNKTDLSQKKIEMERRILKSKTIIDYEIKSVNKNSFFKVLSLP